MTTLLSVGAAPPRFPNLAGHNRLDALPDPSLVMKAIEMKSSPLKNNRRSFLALISAGTSTLAGNVADRTYLTLITGSTADCEAYAVAGAAEDITRNGPYGNRENG
jgi:hypothetical protein